MLATSTTQARVTAGAWRSSFALVAAFFGVELLYALLSGSLALLSDAGHMAADVVALGAALIATRIATRPDRTGRRTYGSYRAEVFASGLAVLLMLAVSVYVVVEAVRRIGEPVEVQATAMLVVGAVGLAVNVIALLLLRGGAEESLNVKGAYLEVVADAAGSVGVIVAGVLVGRTGEPLWDTVVALAIGVFVAIRGVALGRQVLAVLGQHVPAGMEPHDVTADLAGIAGRDRRARPARVDPDLGDARGDGAPRRGAGRRRAADPRRRSDAAPGAARHRPRHLAGRALDRGQLHRHRLVEPSGLGAASTRLSGPSPSGRRACRPRCRRSVS